MTVPKRHHFVPRWYLDQFSDKDGMLNLYDKLNCMWRRQKPNKAMHRNNYYHQSWAPVGIDPYILERKFGNDIEPNGKVCINKMISWEAELTKEEWAAIVIYITSQRVRVPRQAEAAKELLRNYILINGDAEATKMVLDGELNLTINDSFRFDFMKMASSHLYKYFLRMDWEIIEPEGSEFITTDSPVTFFNPEISPPLEPGLGLIGTVVFFPINPKKLLLMRHPEALEQGADLVKPVEEPFAQNRQAVVSQRFRWPEEQVVRHNKLMLELSDRLVAASSKEVLESFSGELVGH